MDANETDLILKLAAAGPCSLDSSPKKNWVEKSGGLPNYICHIAKSIMKSGKSKGQAIAIAVSRVKVWAAGGDKVDKDTQAKAAAAASEWEALKGKNAAKKIVKASRHDGFEYLMLTNIGSFNTEMIRSAWNARERAIRKAKEAAYRSEHGDSPFTMEAAVPMHDYSWIRELWTDYIIVEVEGREGSEYHKVPYTVDGTDVEFGDPTEVKQEWVDAPEEDKLTEAEEDLLEDVINMKNSDPGFLAKIQKIAQRG